MVPWCSAETASFLRNAAGLLGLLACLRGGLGVVFPSPPACREPLECLGDTLFDGGEAVLGIGKAGGQLAATPDLRLEPSGDGAGHPGIGFVAHTGADTPNLLCPHAPG